MPDDPGFNRYMVECESIVGNPYLAVFLVLIDTWWNVNEEQVEETEEQVEVLIDTWWNVNSKE